MGDNPVTDSDLNQVVRNGDSCSSTRSDPSLAAFVDDFLQYRLGQAGYEWRGSAATTNGDAGNNHQIGLKAGMALRSLADEFSAQFKDQFVEMCEKLDDVRAETMKPTIEGVANELFSEGIKWARIVALFVFGSELAVYCRSKNTLDVINIISQSLTSYISEHLLSWINDHGGWEGLIRFNEGDPNGQASDNKWPSVKNLLCLGISALGAITLGAVLTKS